MRNTITASRARAVVALMGSVMVLTTVLGPAPAAQARRMGQHTVVASDGASVEVADLAARGVSSRRGSGRTQPSHAPGRPDGFVRNLTNGAESLIGVDSRVQVTATTSFPASAVAHITFRTPGGSSGCTGWMIGADTLATAGHCVHQGGGGSFYDVASYRISPGRNGSSTPFGTCSANTLFTVNGWATGGNERYDYGAIKLNCEVGLRTGWFGYFWQSASLTGQTSIINGYPGDKPFGTQWRSTDWIRVTEPRQLFYANDTVGGMSGSAVYRNRPAGSPFCAGICAKAIHAYGRHGATSPHDDYNHGTRITEPVFNNLIAWRDA
jgi:glutamyl endopeptidase